MSTEILASKLMDVMGTYSLQAFITHSSQLQFLVSTLLSKMFDIGDRDLPVPTSGNPVIKGCMTKWLRFFVNPKT